MKNPSKKNTAYKILWPIVNIYFKCRFNPKTENKSIIPNEGPIIICGNHVHTHDQFMALMHTRRVVHYMAKKEYFDGKFGFFFRAVGCIPVDRSIKDEKAKNEALEVLKNGGALGLFPEGTRNFLTCKEKRVETLYEIFKNTLSKEEMIKILNSNKTKTSQIDLLDKLLENKKITLEEYKKYALDINNGLDELINKNIITKEEYADSLLLPFKFGAVSMAKKTNATIIPFAINGNYKFRSKNLKAKFGIPFKVGDMDLEAANEKLRNEIKDLLLDLKK